jgi:hypothetical protein
MVTITPAASSVMVTGGSFPYDGSSHAATAVAATSVGTLSNPMSVMISYSGSCTAAPVTVSDGASCTATGTYAGDANHSGSFSSAGVTITATVNPITFTSMIVSASAPGGAVTFNFGSQAACTVAQVLDGSSNPIPGQAKVTLLQGGTWALCNVLGNQAGGGNYTAATQEKAALTVTP